MATIANDCFASALISVSTRQRPDMVEVSAAVGRYCRTLRVNSSDTVAAINWALRSGGDTLSAIRAGRQRAAQLHDRRKRSDPPTPA